MNILLPKAITPEMFGPGTTIPEVDTSAGEVLWATGGTASLGDRRVWKGYTYECVQAITGAPANTYEPDSKNAAAYWLKDEGAPTNRMAPFDKYLFTKTRKNGSITFELKPGFVDGIAIYGVEADKISISVTDGAVTPSDLIPPITNKDLWEQAFGPWEYLFGDLARGTHYTVKGIPIHPNTTITITVSRNDPDVEAAIGYISVGQWRRLVAPLQQNVSGAQYGVGSATRDYSYNEDNKDGTYTEVPGLKAKNITLSCVIAADQAPLADDLLTRILGKAVAIEVSELPRYRHLATVARVTGEVRSVNWPTAQVELQIKGNP